MMKKAKVFQSSEEEGRKAGGGRSDRETKLQRLQCSATYFI